MDLSHSSISSTSEWLQARPCERRVTILVMGVMLLTAVGLLIMSMKIWLIKCSDTTVLHFSGWTPVIAIILLILNTATACTVYSNLSFRSLIASLLCTAVSVFLSINELITYHCSHENPTSSFCLSFLISFNICSDIAPKTTNSTMENISKNPLVPHDEQVSLFVMAVISLICSLILIIMVGVVRQMIGKPVYLMKKRHRTSITVGLNGNDLSAFKNLNRNFNKYNRATADETDWYETKRMEIIKQFSVLVEHGRTAKLISETKNVTRSDENRATNEFDQDRKIVQKSSSEICNIMWPQSGLSTQHSSNPQSDLSPQSSLSHKSDLSPQSNLPPKFVLSLQANLLPQSTGSQ